MNPLLLLAVAAGELLLAGGKNSKAANYDIPVIPDLPDMEDPGGIDPGEQYTPTYTPVNNYSEPTKPQYQSASNTKPATSAGNTIKTVSTAGIKQLQTKNGGTFSAYQQNLADGLHLVKVDSITNIGAVDANQSLSIKSLKNLPAGQIIGRFAGMIYISKTGNKYVVAYGYKTGLIFLIAISKAVITTNDTGKRVVIKNLSKGEYIIS